MMSLKDQFSSFLKTMTVVGCAFAVTPALAQKNVTVPANGNVEGNLLTNPDFDHSGKCSEGWEVRRMTDLGVLCRYPGAIWLNYNNQGEDPAVVQTVENLTAGKPYLLSVGYRAGPTAKTYTKRSDYFAIKVGDMLVNDDRVDISDTWNVALIEFTPTSTSTEIRLIGEYNSDGDVLINYASLKPVETSASIPNVEEAKEKAKDLPATWTRILAYSVHDQTRDNADPANDYYIGHDGNAGKILKGQGDRIHIDQQGHGQVAFRIQGSDGKALYLEGADSKATFVPKKTSAALFIARPPLEPSDKSFASFESVAYPGEFLRHQSYILKLDPANASSPSLLRRDATFRFDSSTE